MKKKNKESKFKTVYFIEPLNEKCTKWLIRNIPDYDCEKILLPVEHRYLDDIVDGLMNDNFKLSKDFR